jgi:hypothetical protein
MWNANPLVQLTFQQTIALCCGNGVEYTSISIKEVTDASSSANGFVGGSVYEGSYASSAGAAVTISFQLSQKIAGFTDESTVYEMIVDNLMQNVGQGNCTTYLHGFAAENGATSLDNVACADSVALSNPSAAPSESTNNHSSRLRLGAIIGIVVAVIFALTVICGSFWLWFIFCRYRLQHRLSRRDIALAHAV